MKNKIIIALSVVLVLSVFGSIFAYAADFDNTDLAAPVISGQTAEAHVISKNADGKTVFKNYDNVEIELDFSHVQNIVNDTRHVYVDNSKAEYWADKDGTVISYRNQSQRESSFYKANLSDSEIIDSKTALRIADLHASSLYGDIIDKYPSCSVTESDYNYEVIYSVNYGVDGCIYGSECGIVINHKGGVGVSGMINHEVVENFDPALVENYSQELLDNIAEANVMAAYMDTINNYELVKTMVVKNGDGYALELYVNVDFVEDGIVFSRMDSYIYNIT
ncbi:MAG: hypothetical protein IKM46_01185 [Clostridia bacterium]|nr:hypothetical protein [Clostridia bacterium]